MIGEIINEQFIFSCFYMPQNQSDLTFCAESNIIQTYNEKGEIYDR